MRVRVCVCVCVCRRARRVNKRVSCRLTNWRNGAAYRRPRGEQPRRRPPRPRKKTRPQPDTRQNGADQRINDVFFSFFLRSFSRFPSVVLFFLLVLFFFSFLFALSRRLTDLNQVFLGFSVTFQTTFIASRVEVFKWLARL